ncbi:response regulator [Lachnospiraceae bacterium MD329]|nr:response regulator [Lachnospiraceae bacterium MD329]
MEDKSMYSAVIVEDEPWALASLQAVFPWEHYNFKPPQGFRNAHDALKFISQNKTDVLFTDIKMPKMSGLELIQKIREYDSQIKIIVISGHDNFSFAQKAISYNVFRYLLKPVNRQDAENLMMKLKTELDSKNNALDIEKKIMDIPNPTFRELLTFINEHYTEKLQLTALAERFHINKSYLSQLFNQYIGYGFSEYITELKMQKAAKMLKRNISGTEIANFLNYDYVYFNKLFKKRFGMTITQYRQKAEEDR